uniref:Uncharacterized protein n=1 Tax=Glossina pallidipes TaxID=7398 RepID=A0A1A9ZC15_GLOPL
MFTLRRCVTSISILAIATVMDMLLDVFLYTKQTCPMEKYTKYKFEGVTGNTYKYYAHSHTHIDSTGELHYILKEIQIKKGKLFWFDIISLFDILQLEYVIRRQLNSTHYS